MRERVHARGLSIIMEEEAADWQGCKIVRCPNCCQVHPAGFCLCLDCGAGWTYRDQEDPVAINAAAAPINVDIDKRSKFIGKTLAFGGRTAGVRSGPASFWNYVEDCLRWNKMWWPRTLDVQTDLARQGYSPTISGKDQMEVWVPQSRVDSGPTHEDIVTWQTANMTAEVAAITSQVLSVLAEVRRTNPATENPFGSNPKMLKEHHAEICKTVVGIENPFEETDDAAAPKAISAAVAKFTMGVQRRQLIVGQAAQQGLELMTPGPQNVGASSGSTAAAAPSSSEPEESIATARRLDPEDKAFAAFMRASETGAPALPQQVALPKARPVVAASAAWAQWRPTIRPPTQLDPTKG
jgi:hypothetical protein